MDGNFTMIRKILCFIGIHDWKEQCPTSARLCNRCGECQTFKGMYDDGAWETFTLKEYNVYMKDYRIAVANLRRDGYLQ